MTNAAITFTALNDLTSGVTSGDEITLNVTLTQWDESVEIGGKSRTTISGKTDGSFFYQTPNYQVGMSWRGEIVFANLTTADLEHEHVMMFFSSTRNKESFTITNLDRAGASMNVERSGLPNISRPSSSFVNQFNYQFVIRGVV